MWAGIEWKHKTRKGNFSLWDFPVLSSAPYLACETGTKLPHLHPGLTDSKNTENYFSHVIKRWMPLLEQRAVMRTLPVCSFPAQEFPSFCFTHCL